MFETIKNILLFVILLSSIVAIHELGHLIAAKLFNVYCKEYSIGMGPKIYSKKFKETEFVIRALPLGGFVAMAGDNENDLETKIDEDIPFERTLKGISKPKRIIVMLAGIFMNFVLAILIYSMIILNAGAYTKDYKPIISDVLIDEPAYESGLLTGDIIEKIEFDNGATCKPKSYTEVISFIESNYDGKGEWILTINRDNKEHTIEVMPKYDESEQRYLIGISFSDASVSYYDVNLINCFYFGFDYTLLMSRIIINSFMNLIKGIGIESLSGPVGIYQTVSEVASYGFIVYMQLVALISINVGIFNLLPLPIFDGGRVVLTLVESVIGKPLSKKTEDLIMKISLALLFTLFIFVSMNDVSRLIGG